MTEYKRFGFDSTSNYVWRAQNLFHLFATFQRIIYNDSLFQVLDGRILGGDSTWHPKVKLRPVSGPSGKVSVLQPVQYCYATYIEIPCTGGTAKLSIEPHCYQFNGYVCTTIMVDIDEDGDIPPPPGGGTGGGGTGPTWPYPCGSGGNNPVPKISTPEPCQGSPGWYPLPE